MLNQSSLGYSIGLGALAGAAALFAASLVGSAMPLVLAYVVVVILGAMVLQDVPLFKSRFRLALGATATMSLIHAVALVIARPMWGAPAWSFALHFAAFTIQAILLALVIAALSHSSQRPATT